MAEEQADHRRGLETQVIQSGIKDSRKGLWFGFLIGVTGFGVVAYCAYLRFQVLAAIIATLDLGSLVGVFIYGSRKRSTERLEKEKAVQ